MLGILQRDMKLLQMIAIFSPYIGKQAAPGNSHSVCYCRIGHLALLSSSIDSSIKKIRMKKNFPPNFKNEISINTRKF